MALLSKEKENRKKYDIKLRESQVVLYIDQQDLVKQKSNNLKSN